MCSNWSLGDIKQLQIIKLVTTDVFDNSQIGECIVNALKTKFNGIEQILKDLNINKDKGIVVKSISNKLLQHKHFTSEWNTNNEIILCQLLSKILKQKLLSEIDLNNSIKQIVYSFNQCTVTDHSNQFERKVIFTYGFFRQSLKLNKQFHYQWIPQVIVFICCDYIDIFPDFITILTNIIYDKFELEGTCETIRRIFDCYNWRLSSESSFISELNIGCDIELNLAAKIYKDIVASIGSHLSVNLWWWQTNAMDKFIIENLKHYQNKARLNFMNKLQQKGVNDRDAFGIYYPNIDSITQLVKTSFMAHRIFYFMNICNEFYDSNDKLSFIVFQSSMVNYVLSIKLVKFWRLFIKQNNIDSTYLLSRNAKDPISRYPIRSVLERQIVAEFKRNITEKDYRHAIFHKLPNIIFSTCFKEENRFDNVRGNEKYFLKSISAIGIDTVCSLNNLKYASVSSYEVGIGDNTDSLFLYMEQCIALCRIKRNMSVISRKHMNKYTKVKTYDDDEYGGISGINTDHYSCQFAYDLSLQLINRLATRIKL